LSSEEKDDILPGKARVQTKGGDACHPVEEKRLVENSEKRNIRETGKTALEWQGGTKAGPEKEPMRRSKKDLKDIGEKGRTINAKRFLSEDAFCGHQHNRRGGFEPTGRNSGGGSKLWSPQVLLPTIEEHL